MDENLSVSAVILWPIYFVLFVFSEVWSAAPFVMVCLIVVVVFLFLGADRRIRRRGNTEPS